MDDDVAKGPGETDVLGPSCVGVFGVRIVGHHNNVLVRGVFDRRQLKSAHLAGELAEVILVKPCREVLDAGFAAPQRPKVDHYRCNLLRGRTIPGVRGVGYQVSSATVLYQERETQVEDARVEGDDLWLTLPRLTATSGWELKPEGVCMDEICVPVPDARRPALLRDDPSGTLFNLTEFAKVIDQPFAHDENQAAWYFGPPSWEWKTRQASRRAPDFTLPDLSGEPHSLSELNGKKVFLLFWASW
jgi:hypothetical protein